MLIVANDPFVLSIVMLIVANNQPIYAEYRYAGSCYAECLAASPQ
jgi:hypothetical protein